MHPFYIYGAAMVIYMLGSFGISFIKIYKELKRIPPINGGNGQENLIDQNGPQQRQQREKDFIKHLTPIEKCFALGGLIVFVVLIAMIMLLVTNSECDQR